MDPDQQNLGRSGKLSLFVIYKFWQNCASVRQVSDLILKTGKHQSSVSLAFVRGIHQWPVNSSHKGPVMRKMFLLMKLSWWNIFRPERNGSHFTYDILQCILFHDKVWISIKIAMKFVNNGLIDIKLTKHVSGQVMAITYSTTINWTNKKL